MRLQRMKDWLEDRWPYLAMGLITITFVSFSIFNMWASYKCIQAGFLGGQLYNFHLVCYILWR